LLGYFKYANFLVDNLNVVLDAELHLAPIVLPLAISFFTFQQVAYLVDAYQGITHEYRFSHYALFVTFFPQLIAGPIVHHREMLPQFMDRAALSPRAANIAIGATIFAIGLVKKTILADGIAVYATPVFARAQAGEVLTFFEAWGGALAYTFQLYFDFSGYSDMAIGGARMFGVRLPVNFHSPYKATSVVDFWRRWHMTLSRFLRDYLYIPLGGNRRGVVSRHANLMITMLLGGLWHGAGWTFVVWGGLHGLYLVINHAWRSVCAGLGWNAWTQRPAWRGASWLITFVAVVVAWVFFRAESFRAAVGMLGAMIGLNGVVLPNAVFVRLQPLHEFFATIGVHSDLGMGGTRFVLNWLWISALFIVAVALPNTQQILRRHRPVLDRFKEISSGVRPLGPVSDRIVWRPSAAWAMLTALFFTAGVLSLGRVSEFLYFQF